MNSGRKNIRELIEGYYAGNLSFEETEMLFRIMADEPSVVDGLLTDDLPHLTAEEIKYPFHSKLLKSYSDLSDEQFEYLCIASAEGDIDAGQQEELEVIAGTDRRKGEIFKTYKKLRLKPDETITYSRKARLRKVTPFAKLVRFSTVALGAAASVAVLVMAFYIFNDNPLQATVELTEVSAEPISSIKAETTVAENPVIAEAAIPEVIKVRGENRELSPPEAEAEPNEFPVTEEEKQAAYIRSVEPVSGAIAMIRLTVAEAPVHLAEVYTAEPVAYHGPLSLRDHIAITFREKLLGEEIPDPSPLKALEIASAGVTGLNRILGWEMDLEVTKEDRGSVNAVAFSSRLLRFQTPLKKTEIFE